MMDEDRRNWLAERRRQANAARLAAAQRADLAPAIEALEAAGETFTLITAAALPAWRPAWMPAGYSEPPWDRVSPDLWRQFDSAGAIQEKLAETRAALEALAQPEDRVQVVFDGQACSLEIGRAAVLAHLGDILAVPTARIWFYAQAAEWLIEVRRDALFVRRG